MKKLVVLICSFTALNSFAQEIKISKGIKQAMDRIDTNTIRSHIAYLADDKLKGRLPGTEGYQTAVDYVIDQYKKIGIAPGGDNGGYTQKLIIRKSTVNNNSAVAILKDKNGNSDSLTFVKDFVPAPHPLNENSSHEGGLVFVGYGVEIPGGYSDYKGLAAGLTYITPAAPFSKAIFALFPALCIWAATVECNPSGTPFTNTTIFPFTSTPL